MENLEIELQMKHLFDKQLNTWKKKNADYGNSFDQSLDDFGITAGVVRISDKFNRIKTLCRNQRQEVKDESIQDTLLDMANYCVMLVRWISSNRPKNNETNTEDE